VHVQEELVRLWIHENKRVFEDRLINAEDHAWFVTLLRGQLAKHFNMEWDNIITNERLIYGDYMFPGADPKVR
jgi:dynein heavy chain